jgi:putative ABC transport system permease protein
MLMAIASMFFSRTPLAWLNLTHDLRRLLTSVAGVTFAVLLMLIFTGFKNALYDSQVRLVNQLNADIILLNRLRDNAFVPRTFARRRLYQAQTIAGVEAAYPFYTGVASWKNQQTGEVRGIRIFAFNPAEPVLLMSLGDQLNQLHLPETVLIDDKSRAEIGKTTPGTVTELAEREVRIIGTFSLGTDFFAPNGNLIMSDQNFLRYLDRNLGTVDLGLIQIAPHFNVDELAIALRQHLPNDVLILTKEQFIRRELNYWQRNSNIGFVFNLLTATGFVVGIVLVYQILYTDVADHWAEYATLKAMGYRNSYLLGVILQEAVILSGLGFVPGLGLSLCLYNFAATATSLSFQMTWERSLSMFALTFIMCLSAGMIAVRKVQTADPAEVFG